MVNRIFRIAVNYIFIWTLCVDYYINTIFNGLNFCNFVIYFWFFLNYPCNFYIKFLLKDGVWCYGIGFSHISTSPNCVPIYLFSIVSVLVFRALLFSISFFFPIRLTTSNLSSNQLFLFFLVIYCLLLYICLLVLRGGEGISIHSQNCSLYAYNRIMFCLLQRRYNLLKSSLLALLNTVRSGFNLYLACIDGNFLS